MSVFPYKDVPAALVPFGKPTFNLIRNEPRIAIFDFKNDLVVILDHTTPANGFIGTVQQAIDAGIISFTRATAASRVNGSGLLETVASGVWRRQYDPVTLLPLGYLPEPQRTNLITTSNTFPAFGNARGVTGQAGAPDGSASMVLLQEGTLNSEHYADKSASVTSGSAYVLSFFVRAFAGLADRNIQLRTATSGSAQRPFNPRTGTWASAGSGASYVDSGIEDWGGGLYRIWMSVTASATGNLVCRAQLLGPGTIYTGDDTSGCYIFGMQLEAGTKLSSYIPTAASTVTRNQDVMYADVTKLPFAVSEYTVLAEAEPSRDTVSSQHNLFSVFKDGNDSAGVRSGTAGSHQLQLISERSNAAQVGGTTGGVAAAHFKVAAAFKEDDAELVSDGVSRLIDNVGLMPDAPTRLYFGAIGAGGFGGTQTWEAPIANAILVPRRLSQAEMIARTAA